MKALDGQQPEFKRQTRDDASRRHNPSEHWDGVSGVYTVRTRDGAKPEQKDSKGQALPDVVGVMCEPTS